MGKKPAASFGAIAFSKDGRVRSEVQALPDNKEVQELKVVERLLILKPALFPPGVAIEPLPERGHDVAIRAPDGELLAEIQCVEIVYRDYARRLTREELASDSFPFRMQIDRGLPLGVEVEKVDTAILDRLQHKLAKCDAPVAGSELWLVIWSGSPCATLSSYYHKGGFHLSPAMALARQHVATASVAPFDRVLFFNLDIRPEGIYPPGWLVP